MTISASSVRTPAGIIRLGTGFCDAKALLTAVELDLFTVVHDGPATEQDVRRRLGLHGRGLRDFLQLLVALGLLEKHDGRYRNAPGADRWLVRGKPTYLGGFLQGSNTNLYPVWGSLTEALRTGRPQAAGGFGELLDNPESLGGFVRMMEALMHDLVPLLIDAFEWPDHTSVLDVGGCRGHLVSRLVQAHPRLSGHVFDLPQLQPFFDELVTTTGLTGKVHFHPGDFFRDPLPRADLVVLGHILHDWDAAQRRFLIDKAYQAVNPGGALLVHDRMLDDRANAGENLVASLNMLLVTEGGAEYPVTELRDQAEAAGFTTVSHRPLGDHETLVVCRKD